MAPFTTAIEFRSYRAASQDRAAAVHVPAGVVLVVADGVGGRPGGGRAAELAVEHITRAAPAVDRPWKPEAWRRLLVEADQSIRRDPAAGETTAVVVAVTDHGIAGASVGDSDARLISADAHSPLTSGRRIKPYLGHGMAYPVGFSGPPLVGTIVVASDGLFNYAEADRISAAARAADLREAARSVAELARNSEGPFYDDVAVVLCRPGNIGSYRALAAGGYQTSSRRPARASATSLRSASPPPVYTSSPSLCRSA